MSLVTSHPSFFFVLYMFKLNDRPSRAEPSRAEPSRSPEIMADDVLGCGFYLLRKSCA
ncbi:hypothetical protein PGTUg99_037539 [Puccinia graminis f. sp. tritici]|uniref:Uncharacterized protein n=1 Tax=Puccinia graminis f. sp. tritici TaxID=56615 RepID=A0A5B0RAQ7_PUCGR|nr:hypothetical protein PGTUg99_037539 [Puccinia graminis f. sp. tritici]